MCHSRCLFSLRLGGFRLKQIHRNVERLRKTLVGGSYQSRYPVVVVWLGLHSRNIYIWVCLKMLCTPKPNGFADHYPYWMAIIGNIPYFQTNPYSPIQLLWSQRLLALKKSKGSIGIGRSSGRANNNEKEFQDKTWWYHPASAYHPCIIHLNSTTPREISEMRWNHSALRTMSFWGCIVPPGQSKKVWTPCSKHRSNSNEINEEDNGKPW